MLKVKIELLDGAKSPSYAQNVNAGMTICSNEDVVLAPGETKLIHTGIKMSIPEGYEIQIIPYPELYLETPLRICGVPKTEGLDDHGEICVIVQNTSERFYTDGIGLVKIMPDVEKNHHPIDSKNNLKGWYDIKKGDRIAQIAFQEVPKIEWEEVGSIN